MLKVIICCPNISSELNREVDDIATKYKYEIDTVIISDVPEGIYKQVNENKEVYLYLLNVEYILGNLDGIDIARNIRDIDRNSYIVFLSDKVEHMSNVINSLTRPSGYLTIPINKNELAGVISNIYRDFLNIWSKTDEIFHVNIASTIYRVDYDKIYYFEAYQKKIYIHTDNQRIGYYDSLSSIEERLNESFIRCHKSYIVNKKYIYSISFPKMKIYMQNGNEVDISRTYKNILKEKFTEFNLEV